MSFILYFRQHFAKTQKLFFAENRLNQIFSNLFLRKLIQWNKTRVQNLLRSLFACECLRPDRIKSLFASQLKPAICLFPGHYNSKAFRGQDIMIYFNGLRPCKEILSDLPRKLLEDTNAIRLKNYNI